MFETLKKMSTPLPRAEALLDRPTSSPRAEERPPDETADEIPFIEVGGPATTFSVSSKIVRVESGKSRGSASPSVTATVPVVAAPPPIQDGKHRSEEKGPITIAFRPAPRPAFNPESPEKRFAPHLICYHEPGHSVSEQYRASLRSMAAHLPGKGPQVMLFTALASGTGTTTVLLNLAITQAKQGKKRVIVVDANLRRPAVAAELGLPTAPGLLEVAAKLVPLSEAIQETGQAGLLALTAGELVAPDTRRPSAQELQTTLHEINNQFDWVLVDAPSWDGGPDLVALSPASNAVYLVIRPPDIESPAVKELGRLVTQLGCHLRGYVLAQW
jgi:Mrp family chromosome partitioning ATPase